MIPFVSEKDHSHNSPDVWEVVQTRDMWQPFAEVQGGEDEGLGSRQACRAERESHADKQ